MRYYSKMPLFKNINRGFLWTATGVIGCLCVTSFFAAWGRDEGTLGEGIIANLLAGAFMVLRLPSHLLLWPVIELSSNLSGQLAFLLFLVGLFGNALFYALILERTYYFVVGIKRAKINRLENDA